MRLYEAYLLATGQRFLYDDLPPVPPEVREWIAAALGHMRGAFTSDPEPTEQRREMMRWMDMNNLPSAEECRVELKRRRGERFRLRTAGSKGNGKA